MNTDANGRIFLDWNTKFYRQSASDFMMNPIDAPFVIIGTTAEGITNPQPTPAGAKYPHEIQITFYIILLTVPLLLLLFGLVEQSFWEQLSQSLLLHSQHPIYGLSVPILFSIIGGLIYAAWYAFQSSYLIDVSGIILISFLLWSIESFRNFITQYFLRLQIKQQFGTYVSPDLVKKLQDDPTLLRLGGETKRLTFLFSDIRGFTPISEKYQSDPQGLTTLINRFLDNQTEIILKTWWNN